MVVVAVRDAMCAGGGLFVLYSSRRLDLSVLQPTEYRLVSTWRPGLARKNLVGAAEPPERTTLLDAD